MSPTPQGDGGITIRVSPTGIKTRYPAVVADLEVAAAIGLIRPATFVAALRAGLITYQRDRRLDVVPTFQGRPLVISNDTDARASRVEVIGNVRQLRRGAP